MKRHLWTPDSIVAACGELDAERLATGEMHPLTQQVINAYDGEIDLPSSKTISNQIGLERVNARLGRVTTEAVLDWSNAQWGQNAQWAQDLLEAKGIYNMPAPEIDKLASAGLMPNRTVITSEWGGLPNYREKNGIARRIYQTGVENWHRETVLEICHELDRQRLEAGNMYPLKPEDIDVYAMLSPGSPSWAEIEQYVGDEDGLNRELGRITNSIALEWTPSQWRQNAEWIRDLMAEQGVERVTDDHIKPLARAGLAPSVKTMARKYKTTPKWRVATHIEPNPSQVLSKGWNKGQSTRHGQKFAAYLGKEIGFPIMPVQDDINAGAKEGVTPPLYQIGRLHGSLEQYQVDLGFVNEFLIDQWTDQDWKDNFEWLRDVWRQNGREVTSLVGLLKVAGKLHIGPSVDIAVDRKGSLTEYAKLVGFDSEQLKRTISDEGVMRAAINLATRNKGPLTKETVEDDEFLSKDMLKGRFHGILNVNLKLGWITGTNGWDRNKLLWWGVTSFIRETGKMPHYSQIEGWSKDKKGPSTKKVSQSFENSLDVFHAELNRAEKWMENQIDRLGKTAWAANGGLNKGILKWALIRNPELFHPNDNIQPTELDIFYRLQAASADERLLVTLMDRGINFSQPESQLRHLAQELARCNMLNSATLKQLEPYIIGLAPPEVEMSWSDFVHQYRNGKVS